MALRSLVGMMKVLPRRVPGSRALATAPKPKGNADLMALREQMPEYEDELYKMFSGHVADGSTSYAPGQRTVHNLTSEEEQEEEEVEEEEEEEEEPDAQAVNTPVSVGSKRSTSSRSAQGFRSTGSSPQKKVKSPVVRAMCDKIGGLTTAIGDSCAFFNETLSQRAAQRAAAMQQAQQAAKDEAERKKKEEEDKIDLIMSLAKECGFTEDSAEWIGVHNIIRDEKAMAWFLKNGIPGRIATIKHYANREEDAGPPVLDSSNDGVVCDGDDDSDEEFDQLLIATFQHQQACAAAALYGKYYLVDSGYPNRPGYLAPYRTTRHHLDEFRNAEEPQGKEEVFNYAHSSLRNCIERCFGVLKQKFRILLGMPRYPLETQTHIIVACMALHNFIRLSQQRDQHFARCDRDPNYVAGAGSEHQPQTEEPPAVLDSAQMNEFRDYIALQMFLDGQ